MKKILSGLIIIALLGFSIAYFLSPAFAERVEDLYLYSACDKPQTYRIGEIDERFAIDQDTLLLTVKEASDEWSKAYGKELFKYDQEQGDVVVQLKYDERQELTNEIGKLNDRLDGQKSEIDPQIADFENRIDKFKARVASLNNQIEYWNNRGGAPEGEFEKLLKEQQELRQEQAKLDDMAQTLNRSTVEYNSQVGELNETIDTFNTALQTRPEEGLYNGQDNTITIFFMANQDELLHTLTHEFGHALGIEHLENPDAVMYYQTNMSLGLLSDDIKAMQFACRERTLVDIGAERAVYVGAKVDEFFKKYDLIPQ